MGGVLLFFLVAGCLGMAVTGSSREEIYRTAVYWACILLIGAVHVLSRRANEAEKETRALRGEIDGIRDEIRRASDGPLRVPGVHRSSEAAPRPGPWDRVSR